MKRCRLAAAVWVLAAAAAAAPLAQQFDGRLDRGLALLYQGQYEACCDTFRAFIREHPQHPAGYFLMAGAYQLRSLADESDAWDPGYAAYLDSALARSTAAVKADPRDAWAYFFRGGTYAYMAARDARHGSMLAALNKGLTGMDDLDRAVKLDPALYDAYLGLGSYHYFRTKAASIFRWLPFIGDKRDQGVAELALAAERGRYARVMAQNGMVWVCIDYGKYDRALAAALALEQEFPANHAFHWGAPEVYFRTGQWAKAAAGYRRLLQLVEDARPMNNYNRVAIKARLANCLYEGGSYADAYRTAREAIELPLDDASAARLRKERIKAQQVMQQAQRRLPGARP
ncbi:MAG TPA: tetratricopeptide repeat protein [Candidatus Edwardsbacteria bacterium]|nr:tetratricopeptide repeat protein [Candidatus Edwardsbacteria bacterium]